MNNIDPQMKNQKELTPFEYTKSITNSNIRKISITSIIVVSYIFSTAIIGTFIDFGWTWWAITMSYFVAIGGGIGYVITSMMNNEDLIKLYEKEYNLNLKNRKND